MISVWSFSSGKSPYRKSLASPLLGQKMKSENFITSDLWLFSRALLVIFFSAVVLLGNPKLSISNEIDIKFFIQSNITFFLFCFVIMRYLIHNIYNGSRKENKWFKPTWSSLPFRIGQPYLFFHFFASFLLAVGIAFFLKFLFSGFVEFRYLKFSFFALSPSFGLLVGIKLIIKKHGNKFFQ